MATWTGAVLILQVVALKSRFLSKYFDGEPAVVIMDGQIMEAIMKKMRYRVSDLMEQLRQKSIFDISQVEFAVLETSGKLSIMKKSNYQPVTPKDLNITTNYTGLSTELIYDGVIIDQNLKKLKLDRNWMEQQLRANKVSDPSEVLLAELNTQGELYIAQVSHCRFIKMGYASRQINLTDVDFSGFNHIFFHPVIDNTVIV